jgi:hypothetical protein
VVGKQLYDLVADEQGLQHALYALQSALVRGVICCRYPRFFILFMFLTFSLILGIYRLAFCLLK